MNSSKVTAEFADQLGSLLNSGHNRIIRRVHRLLFAVHVLLSTVTTNRRCCASAALSSLGVVAAMALSLAASPCPAQGDDQRVRITGDRFGGFVLPIEPMAANTNIRALRAWSWKVDDTQRLLLQGDVAISLGLHSFRAPEAVVWINRLPSDQGLINQIAIYFEQVDDPTRQAGLSVKAERLLVTASTRGEVMLNISVLEQRDPPGTRLLRQAEDRLAEYLRRLAAAVPPLAHQPQFQSPGEEPVFIPVPGGEVPRPATDLPRTFDRPEREREPWLVSPTGTVRFSADHVEISRGEQENTITAIGHLVVEMLPDSSNEDPLSSLTLTSERAVIFTDPGPLIGSDSELQAQNVRGVYLEGNVQAMTHGGEYIVRAPQVYYDFRSQQAIMLNSLLRVQPRDFHVPVYARAEEMRQIARDQWEARRVVVSASEFHQPHLAIGANRALITRRESPGGDQPAQTIIDSRHNAIEIEGVPVFYWPQFQGSVDRPPLRQIEVGSRSNDGLRLLTTWNAFSLFGAEEPEGVEADLKFDAFTKRGGGTGGELRYDVGDAEGSIDLYGLYDTGTDRTASGRNVEPEDEWRGVAIIEHQDRLSEYWSYQAQLSLISDPTFITSWREDDFAERREYETSLYLKHQRENAALTLLGKYALQDFISNSYLLASRQYSVDKLPELTYRRYGDSLFGDVLTYSMENRITHMRMVFVDQSVRELGVRRGAFGIGPTVPVEEMLIGRGLTETWVNRFDSRHELSLPLDPGPFNVTPFVVGRFTGYDDDFDEFSSDADEMRFYGAGGVRINTQVQRVFNGVEHRLLDLHRLRHLVEPYLTLWSAHSSVNQEDLPIYDEQVESIADGNAVQIGMRNTWQTQRGGPGQWHSVDWLTIDTYAVVDDQGAPPQESPTPQWFEYRPEYSQLGDHARAHAIWLLSDNLTLAGDLTWSMEDDTLARSSVGVELRHSPFLSTYVEYRSIDANDLELLDVGWLYQITPKYRVAIVPQWDFAIDDFRSFNVRVTRSFPDFEVTLVVRYDRIRDDTLFGASLDLARF